MKASNSLACINRRIWGILLLVFLFLLACGEQADSFRFIFMTDIHLQPERAAPDGFKKAITRVNKLAPDFVITGGDLIMDALGQAYGRADSLYALYDSLCANFDMPVYNTLGNHEVFGLYTDSGINPDHPEYGKRMYKNRGQRSQTYYSFDHKGWHFIVLDAIGFSPERRYYGYVDSTQIVWLQRDLQSLPPDKPIVVALHIPLVSVVEQMRHGGTAALSRGMVVTNSKAVLDILNDYNLKLVLQGHLHIVEEIIYRDVHFITGGAVSGAWWTGPHEGFQEGVVVVDVNPDGFDWQYVDYGWTVPEKP